MTEIDFSEDFRVYMDPDGVVLLPDLFDHGYDRYIQQDADGMWELRWSSDGVREPGTGFFATVEEALHAALGDPVDLDDISGDGTAMSMTIQPRSYDREFEIVVRVSTGPYPWEAYINSQDVFPKHRYGNTYQEALATLMGVEAAGEEAYVLLPESQRG